MFFTQYTVATKFTSPTFLWPIETSFWRIVHTVSVRYCTSDMNSFLRRAQKVLKVIIDRLQPRTLDESCSSVSRVLSVKTGTLTLCAFNFNMSCLKLSILLVSTIPEYFYSISVESEKLLYMFVFTIVFLVLLSLHVILQQC